MARIDPRTVVSLCLALAGPALVWLVAWRGLMGWHDEDEAVAARNAGRVFNAQVIDGGAAAAMDRLLEQRDPEVIVLGPSYANTNTDPVRLATQLGISKDEIVLMSVPNSVGAHWYAVLKYRVFGPGYRPKLVVVVSGLQSMLLATPLTESSFVNLEVQLPEGGDPLISQKSSHRAGLQWARIREQRGKVRAAWFDWLRDAPLTALTPLRPLQIRGALARVFADENVDMSLHGSSTPVVEANRGPERVYDATMLPKPEDSFIGDITALAAEHGARVVWVRPPMSPLIPDELDDVVLPGVQEAVIEMVEAEGGSYLDMRRIQMTSQMFRNEDHMNEEGSRLFSERLAGALKDIDALHPAIGAGGLPPLRPVLTVEGGEVQLGSPGEPIDLPPGATARWAFDGWEPVRGTFSAEALVEREGGIDGITLSVDGRNVWLRPEPGHGTAVWGQGQLDNAPAPTGPFTVAIGAPAGGAPVRVASLSLGRKLRRAFVIGDADAAAGRSVDWLDAGEIRYPKDPIRVPGWDRPVLDLPDAIAAFETERWAFLADAAMEVESGVRCSPFRVQEDDAVLPIHNVSCEEVERLGHGRVCHDSEQIRFGAPDGTDPANNGRTYRIVLDPARRCGDIPWVYPIDEVKLTLPPSQIASLTEGANWLMFDARYVNHREAPLVVRLRVDGELHLDTAFDGRDLKRGPKVWRLDTPVPPDASEVVLELESRAYVFYLLRQITLSERQPSL